MSSCQRELIRVCMLHMFTGHEFPRIESDGLVQRQPILDLPQILATGFGGLH